MGFRAGFYNTISYAHFNLGLHCAVCEATLFQGYVVYVTQTIDTINMDILSVTSRLDF